MIALITLIAVMVGAFVVALTASKAIDHMDAKGVPESWQLTAVVSMALAYGAIGVTIIVAVTT